MTLKLNGSSSGHVNLDAKAAAASNTLTLPDTASGELVAADSSGHINLADSKMLKLGTGGDLTITHDGSDAKISNDTGAFVIQDSHAGANAVIIRKGGEVELLHNNVLACETSATGLAFPNGKGIDFSATADGTTMGSELLDDYEEGTFQPSWSSTGVGLTFTYNSDHRHGFYTKIGNLVTFNLYISSVAAPSGDATNPLYVSGLPYSSANTTANTAALTIGFYFNITAGTDEVFPLAYVNKNTSQISLTWSRRNSDTNQQMISSDLTDYTWLTVAGSYRV